MEAWDTETDFRTKLACLCYYHLFSAPSTYLGYFMGEDPQGDWALSVWLEDAAGNVDPAKAATVHLRYGTDPAAGSGASSSLAAAGLRLRWVVRYGRRLIVVLRSTGGRQIRL